MYYKIRKLFRFCFQPVITGQLAILVTDGDGIQTERNNSSVSEVKNNMSDVLTSYHKSVINRAIMRYGVEIEIRRTKTNEYGEPVGDNSYPVYTGKALLSYSSQPILASLTEGATLTTKKNPQLLLRYADIRTGDVAKVGAIYYNVTGADLVYNQKDFILVTLESDRGDMA